MSALPELQMAPGHGKLRQFALARLLVAAANPASSPRAAAAPRGRATFFLEEKLAFTPVVLKPPCLLPHYRQRQSCPAMAPRPLAHWQSAQAAKSFKLPRFQTVEMAANVSWQPRQVGHPEKCSGLLARQAELKQSRKD